MINLYVCSVNTEDCDFEQEKIILGSDELWSAHDLHDCSEDAILSRGLTDANKILEVSNTLRTSDYEVIFIDFDTNENDFDAFKGDLSTEILKKYNNPKT